jgi:hypothetical protein
VWWQVQESNLRREWIPVEVEVVPEGWIPPTEDKRGDVAVLKMTAGRPAGATAVPLRRPHQTEDRHFAVQGFPDGTLIGATGVIRTQLSIDLRTPTKRSARLLKIPNRNVSGQSPGPGDCLVSRSETVDTVGTRLSPGAILRWTVQWVSLKLG